MITNPASHLSLRPKPEDHPSNMADSERELLIFRAQLCEQSGRFDDMVTIMNDISRTYGDLSEEERNLLSCAYKNVIGSRRTSWRIIHENLQQPLTSTTNTDGNNKTSMAILSISNKLETQQQQQQQQPYIITTSNEAPAEPMKYDAILVQSFLKTIEAELRLHCGNIIDILTKRLIPSATGTGESRVFFYKMKGDYMRYLCEISIASERKEKANESLLAYKAACDKAMIELPPTHPVRLGLMLNFSVFYYEIMKSPERSCRLAKQAFDDAIAELDTLSEESYRDSTIIMQLLRDNLNLWESEQSIQANNIAEQ